MRGTAPTSHARLGRLRDEGQVAVTSVATGQDLPATRKEQALWMLDRLAPGRGIANLGMLFRVEQQLRWWPLQEALNHVVARHPALRANLRFSGSTVRKRILTPAESAIDLETAAASEDDLDATLA